MTIRLHARYLLSLICLLTLSTAPCVAYEQTPPTPSDVAVIEPPYVSTYKEYEQMREQGDLLKAHELLSEAIAAMPNGAEKDRYTQTLYNLNIAIIFSRTMTPESTWHEVVPGDTIGKISDTYNTPNVLIMKTNGLRNHIIRPGQKLKVMTGTFSIFVDKSDNILDLYLNDVLVKRYRVATGKNNSTPVGSFVVESKLEDPTWFHAGAVVPPDSPDNILGTRWLGIDYPGYGIHGTTIPESIGSQSTSGCVRMINEEVEELYTIVPYGTKVEIVD